MNPMTIHTPERAPQVIVPAADSRRQPGVRGFTLLELLVVIVIIGILASIGLPALRGLGSSNLAAATNRQLLDDLAYARLRAISDRTTVYMVFVPPTNIFQRIQTETDPVELKQLENLVPAQYRGYALLAERTVGDQPGQHTPRYLTEWRTLPEGTFLAPYLFDPARQVNLNPYSRALPTRLLPFPNARADLTVLPYLAFDPHGRLLLQRNEVLTWMKGGIFYPRNNSGDYLMEPPDLVLTKAITDTARSIEISWLTGRAEVERVQFE